MGARINVSEAVVPEELHYYIGPQWGEKGSEVAFQFPKNIYRGSLPNVTFWALEKVALAKFLANAIWLMRFGGYLLHYCNL